MVKERDVMKKWISDDLKLGGRWWYRIPDTPYAGYKPADVFGSVLSVPWLLEFKVNRRKTIPFNPKEVKAHQLYELRKFVKNGRGRSAVVVYDMHHKRFVFHEIS